MASTPSIETLTRENMELYQELLLYRTEVRELEDMVDALKKKIRMLLDHIPAGALPAPTVFSDPRLLPGADSDGAASSAAAGAGGGPPVARSLSSHGVVPSLGPSSAHDLYDALAAARPALAPSASEVGPCTGYRIAPSEVVSEIPPLHATYANLSPTGHWRYWKRVPGGYVWDPKWVEEGDE